MAKKSESLPVVAVPPALKKDVSSILARMKALVISTRKEAEDANLFLHRIKTTEKDIKIVFASDLKAAKAKVKSISNEQSILLDPLVLAEATIKGMILAFERSESERLAAENAKRLARETLKLEKQGLLSEEAFDLAVQAFQPKAPSVLEGTTVLSNWQARLTDKTALLRAVLEGTAPSDYIILDESFARAQAKAFEDPSKAPPGVVFEDIGSVRIRTVTETSSKRKFA
jgi:hypothetical protein